MVFLATVTISTAIAPDSKSIHNHMCESSPVFTELFSGSFPFPFPSGLTTASTSSYIMAYVENLSVSNVNSPVATSYTPSIIVSSPS